MARDSLFPPKTTDNRSFERAAELAQQQLDWELEVPGVSRPADDGLSEYERQQLCSRIGAHRAKTRDEARERLKIVPIDCQD